MVSVMAHLASSAVRYAERGLHVFPLAPGTKIPLRGTHGSRDASRDPDRVRAWWAKTPRANIGGATGARSGTWVLDVDAHHDGDKSLAKLEAEHGPLPHTTQATTPRGGPWQRRRRRMKKTPAMQGGGLWVGKAHKQGAQCSLPGCPWQAHRQNPSHLRRPAATFAHGRAPAPTMGGV